MNDDSGSQTAAQIFSLCDAVRDAITMLELTVPQQADLLNLLVDAEKMASSCPADTAALRIPVRSIRYVLVEIADGPIAAFMADAAAQIIDDGIGRLFS